MYRSYKSRPLSLLHTQLSTVLSKSEQFQYQYDDIGLSLSKNKSKKTRFRAKTEMLP